MGNLIHRSSSSKHRLKNEKQKQLQKLDTLPQGERTIISAKTRQNSPNESIQKASAEWTKTIELQQPIQNINDPPGAPTIHANNYPAMTNDIMTQSWSSHYDTNNQFYNGNGISMVPVSYDPNQYVHDSNNLIINQSQQLPQEEMLMKKVQFAHPLQQQVTTKSPLTNTLSWHEQPTISTTELTNPSAKQESIPNRSSTHRSGTNKSTIAISNPHIEKPIYVGIDHRATLAERGQTTVHKRPQKNNTKNPSETTMTNKTRSHTNHHHHHHAQSDSPPIKAHASSQDKSGNSTRQLTTTSTSTSAIIPTKSTPNQEQLTPNESERKTARTRTNRQSQHADQQQSNENETKSSRTRPNHPQSKQEHQRTTNRNHSPSRNDPVRRVEIKTTTDTNNQQRQKQSSATSNITRTRV